MSNENKFEHKGIPITIKDNGEFMAKIGGKEIVAPSIAALKKKLDRVDPFEPFEGFCLDWRDEIEKFTVTGVSKNHRHNSYHWVTSRGAQHSHVYAATKENIAIAKQYIAAKEKHEKIRKEHGRIEEQLKDSLVPAPKPGSERS